ncbi:hypothetical protein NDU88_008524 [Pleurodeles waltl]|uniref:Secreted protein n=1 Tax=Pleurodeles waltl TaxID=8319 RepID=A0AAV7QNS4_PLEWA|nr:hypothetical protein NDU88_008524 [Pleurodeles waltl]
MQRSLRIVLFIRLLCFRVLSLSCRGRPASYFITGIRIPEGSAPLLRPRSAPGVPGGLEAAIFDIRVFRRPATRMKSSCGVQELQEARRG